MFNQVGKYHSTTIDNTHVQQSITKIECDLCEVHYQFKNYLQKLKTFSQLNVAVHKIDTFKCDKKSQILVTSLVSTLQSLISYLGNTIEHVKQQLKTIENNQLLKNSQAKKHLNKHQKQIYEIPVYMQKNIVPSQELATLLEEHLHDIKTNKGIQNKDSTRLCVLMQEIIAVYQSQSHYVSKKLQNFKVDKQAIIIYEVPVEIQMIKQQRIYEENKQLYEIPVQLQIKENQYRNTLTNTVNMILSQPDVKNRGKISLIEQKIQNQAILIEKLAMIKSNIQQIYEIQVQISIIDHEKDNNNQVHKIFNEIPVQQERLNSWISNGSSQNSQILAKNFQFKTQLLHQRQQKQINNIFEIPVQINPVKQCVEQDKIPEKQETPESQAFTVQNQCQIHQLYDQDEENSAENSRKKYERVNIGSFLSVNQFNQFENIQVIDSVSINQVGITSQIYHEVMQQKVDLQQQNLILENRVCQLEKITQTLRQEQAIKQSESDYLIEEYTIKIQRQMSVCQEIMKKLEKQLQEKSVQIEEKRKFEQQIQNLSQIIINKDQELREKDLFTQQIMELSQKYSKQMAIIKQQKEELIQNYKLLDIDYEELRTNKIEDKKIFEEYSKRIKFENQKLNEENYRHAEQIERLKAQICEVLDKFEELQEEKEVHYIFKHKTQSNRKSRNKSQMDKSRKKYKQIIKLEKQNQKLHKQLIDRLQDLDENRMVLMRQQDTIEELKDKLAEYECNHNLSIDFINNDEYQYLKSEVAQLEEVLQQKQMVIQYLKNACKPKIYGDFIKKSCSNDKNYAERYKKSSILLNLESKQELGHQEGELFEQQYSKKLQKIILQYEDIICKNLEVIESLQEEVFSFMKEGIQRQNDNQELSKNQQQIESEVYGLMNSKASLERQNRRLQKLIASGSLTRTQVSSKKEGRRSCEKQFAVTRRTWESLQSGPLSPQFEIQAQKYISLKSNRHNFQLLRLCQ